MGERRLFGDIVQPEHLPAHLLAQIAELEELVNLEAVMTRLNALDEEISGPLATRFLDETIPEERALGPHEASMLQHATSMLGRSPTEQELKQFELRIELTLARNVYLDFVTKLIELRKHLTASQTNHDGTLSTAA